MRRREGLEAMRVAIALPIPEEQPVTWGLMSISVSNMRMAFMRRGTH
jgi:hypothetical protein